MEYCTLEAVVNLIRVFLPVFGLSKNIYYYYVYLSYVAQSLDHWRQQWFVTYISGIHIEI